MVPSRDPEEDFRCITMAKDCGPIWIMPLQSPASADPSNQNQRVGLTEVDGAILVGWGSFSDWGVYHGWLMAFDPTTLTQIHLGNPRPNDQHGTWHGAEKFLGRRIQV